MGMMDNLSDEAKGAMNDPDKRQQIEQIAKEKGISLEQAAKEHLSMSDNSQ